MGILLELEIMQNALDLVNVTTQGDRAIDGSRSPEDPRFPDE
jgi:hypothetical protein